MFSPRLHPFLKNQETDRKIKIEADSDDHIEDLNRNSLSVVQASYSTILSLVTDFNQSFPSRVGPCSETSLSEAGLLQLSITLKIEGYVIKSEGYLVIANRSAY